MPNPEKQLTSEQYKEAADSLHVLAGMLLFDFARHGQGVRDLIAQNFIARADALVGGIFRLWEIQDYGDCWILHRALLDRLFHLHVLNKENQFDVFDDWSFKMQYEAANRVRSDPAMKDRLAEAVEKATPEQKARYQRLVKDPPKWRRPRPEDVAKDMDLSFLYTYGYDFASAHVHPMANDGQQDFFRITRLEPAPAFPDWRVVLNNSVLVATMTLQEALNASTLSWRRVVYDSVSGIREFLGSGSPECFVPIGKTGKLFGEDVSLGQPIGGEDNKGQESTGS